MIVTASGGGGERLIKDLKRKANLGGGRGERLIKDLRIGGGGGGGGVL